MNLAAAVVAGYGLFSLIGGVIGYVKAKSAASLIAGSLAGILLFASSYGVRQGNSPARMVSLIVAVLLGVRFFKTWLKTHRIMPDLLMIVFSLATLILVGLEMVQG